MAENKDRNSREKTKAGPENQGIDSPSRFEGQDDCGPVHRATGARPYVRMRLTRKPSGVI